jgi:hypothetical protein
MKVYSIVDEFSINDKKIAVLNEKRAFQDYNTQNVLVGGKKIPYSLTHNELWIMLQTDEILLGKEVTFTN